ncbi:DUF3817 domain-containing protein [Pseudomonas sp. R3-56]|uniref:DUF3817 domain-containing protein n=1 Tax=Pseudomonas sp. R3-56 TaxID=2817401 RepID=UPI003DA9DA27
MHNHDFNVSATRRLRWMALFEGSTLLLLLGVAVPLKHLFGYPHAVSWLGPVHGVAFIIYIWLTLNVASAQGWSQSHLLRVVTAAFVPLGGFFTALFLLQNAAPKERE